MKLTISIVAAAFALCTAFAANAQEPRSVPDIFKIKANDLSPEDCAFDVQKGRYYQSNLFRGKIHVTDLDGSSFDIYIPKVSNDVPLSTPYQMSGLSLDKPTNPTRLYGVAKDRQAFVFKSDDPTQSVHPHGFNRFVAYDLPVTAKSQPAWSIRLDAVQDELEKKLGGKARPFGPVDSAQDKEGNSYVAFALGAPAIAKVSPDGKTVEAWAWEDPVASRQPRVGYTGITFDPESNRLIAFAGPRILTSFDLSSNAPGTPIPVIVEGSLSIADIHSAEKINLITSTDGTGPRLLATNAPYVYSFRSTSSSAPWTKVSYKSTTREEFKHNGLSVVCEGNFRSKSGKRGRQIYAQGAYFSEGSHSTRTEWPMYKLDGGLLRA